MRIESIRSLTILCSLSVGLLALPSLADAGAAAAPVLANATPATLPASAAPTSAGATRSAGAATPTPTIHVDEAWVRWLPAGVPAAGYVTLTNTGDKPVTLVGAASSFFRDVSIHRSINRGGSMGMEPVSGIKIDPHSKLEFASSGYHLMLMQPTESLESRREVSITLRFADGASLAVPFEVRKSAGLVE
jgi:copper(I)-binding protein